MSATSKVKITVELPENIATWLKKIADARGETVDEVLTWTLGSLLNFYERWMTAAELAQLRSSLKRQGK